MRTLLDHSSGLLFVFGPDRRITYASPAVIAQLPSPGIPVVGTPGHLLIHRESADVACAAMDRCRATGERQVVDLRLLLGGRREESAYEANRWFEVTVTNLLDDPNVRGVVANAHDITARVAHEKELEHLAFHDRLTGLPNRLRLESELERDPVGVGLRAVLVLDLDGFKQVNDRLGLEAGDAVLRSTAFRLRRGVGSTGLAAYLGGDEFAVVLPSVISPDDAVHLAEQLAGALSEPIRAADEDMLTVRASFGVAVDETGLMHGDELLRRADSAMHQAKRQGRGCVAFFDAGGAARAAERMAVAERLIEAEDRDELVLHYQPLLSLGDDVVRTAEALIRWQVEGRLVPPDDFISIAEETGLVVSLGTWALRRACADLLMLKASRPVQLSVNVSARQLHSPGFLRCVERVLSVSGVDPSGIIIELTESAVVEDPDAAEAVLRQLKRLGLGLALDDFGTGYSSLSYLLRLPVDILKVDRAFAGDVATNDRTRLLLRGITNLAHDLGMSVTVEGIETAEQLQTVRDTGCDTAQGYCIGRPVPMTELHPLILPSAY